jgi:hypothetical protein
MILRIAVDDTPPRGTLPAKSFAIARVQATFVNFPGTGNRLERGKSLETKLRTIENTSYCAGACHDFAIALNPSTLTLPTRIFLLEPAPVASSMITLRADRVRV